MPLPTDHSDRYRTGKGDIRDIEANIVALLQRMFEEDIEISNFSICFSEGHPKRTGVESIPAIAVWVDDVDFASPSIGQQEASRSLGSQNRRKKANIYKRFLANVMYIDSSSSDPHKTESDCKWICEKVYDYLFAHQNINNVCNGPFEGVGLEFDGDIINVDNRRQSCHTGQVKVIYSKTAKSSTSEKR